MKKEIRQTSELGIVQITTLDERWYLTEDGLFLPSVTWIADYYPKGIGFMKWLASKGWDEAELIKQAAGDKGTKVHRAISYLIDALKDGGEPLTMGTKFVNDETGLSEEFMVEEWEAIMSFAAWWDQAKPTPISREKTVINLEYEFAGTVDFHCKIDGKDWIVDFKTSKTVYPSHQIQVSAYKSCGFPEDTQLAILQVGYKLNKRGWKFNEVQDRFDLFLAARAIWANENSNERPKQRDYPESIQLTNYEVSSDVDASIK